jgi:hypothetical protein
LRDNVVEPENVTLKKSPEIFRSGGDVMKAEQLAHEAHIGAAWKIDLFDAVMSVEFRGKRFRKRFYTRTAGMDERAVDVEQNEPHHAPGS